MSNEKEHERGKFAADSGRQEKFWIGENSERFEAVASALSHRLRRKILQLLAEGSFSVVNIAKRLDVPVTTVHFNVNVLENAGLVNVIENASARGKEHVVSRKVDRVMFDLMMHRNARTCTHVYDLPIGSYHEAKVKPPCGMASEERIIGRFDRPSTFLTGERVKAQVLWASGGTLEYRVPNDELKGAVIRSLSISIPNLTSMAEEFSNDSLNLLANKNGPENRSVWIDVVDGYGSMKKDAQGNEYKDVVTGKYRPEAYTYSSQWRTDFSNYICGQGSGGNVLKGETTAREACTKFATQLQYLLDEMQAQMN